MRAFLRSNRAALRYFIRRFVRRREGVALVEFAMVLPAMLTMYFGIVEVAQGVMVNRKVTLLNRSLADLSSQARLITNTDVADIFAAAGTVMMPYTDVAPSMMFASVVIDAGGVARICWSEQRNSTAPARGTVVTVPPELRVPNTSVIMARTSYRYTPQIGHIITGPITLGNNTIYMRPRLGDIGGVGSVEQVARQGLAMCPT